MLRPLILLAGLATLSGAHAAGPDCRRQVVEQSVIEMCLMPGAAFQHDTYVLKVDNAVLLAVADDYAEKVALEHTIPDGPAIEFALSRQGEKTVRISGGCVPVGKDGVEVARVCNFSWGRHRIVKDVRFDFQ